MAKGFQSAVVIEAIRFKGYDCAICSSYLHAAKKALAHIITADFLYLNLRVHDDQIDCTHLCWNKGATS